MQINTTDSIISMDHLRKKAANGKVHFDEYTDQWGSFRSVFIPATSPGGVRYVTCVDLEISNIAAMLRKQLLYTSLLGCLVFMIAIVATMLMIHPMSRTIVALTEGVSRITRGDLSVNLECTRTDELGHIARDMNGMVANLRNIVGPLQEILEQINAVSFQVNQIATASGEQTITTSEISKSIHQITHVVQETAQSAHESADAANRMQLLAGRLQELMGQFRTAETGTASASGTP